MEIQVATDTTATDPAAPPAEGEKEGGEGDSSGRGSPPSHAELNTPRIKLPTIVGFVAAAGVGLVGRVIRRRALARGEIV